MSNVLCPLNRGQDYVQTLLTLCSFSALFQVCLELVYVYATWLIVYPMDGYEIAAGAVDTHDFYFFTHLELLP